MGCSSWNRPPHPMPSLHVSDLRWWGPRVGRPVCLVGQPPSGPTDLAFWPVVASWAHLSMAWGLSFTMSVSCFGGPYTPYSDMCRVRICQNIVSWIKPHHYAVKLAQNHLHTF